MFWYLWFWFTNWSVGIGFFKPQFPIISDFTWLSFFIYFRKMIKWLLPKNWSDSNHQLSRQLFSSWFRGDLNWKIPTISASGQNFLDPLPLLKFWPYRWKRRYFIPKSNYKVRIFPNFKPPLPISAECQTSQSVCLNLDNCVQGRFTIFLIHYSLLDEIF